MLIENLISFSNLDEKLDFSNEIMQLLDEPDLKKQLKQENLQAYKE